MTVLMIKTPLRLLILRGDERRELVLTPRNGWGGRGSLGCHILPP
jgi:26S proteasome non-ATPase regulatory subunit 9